MTAYRSTPTIRPSDHPTLRPSDPPPTVPAAVPSDSRDPQFRFLRTARGSLSEDSKATEALEAKLADNPDDASARYQLGVLLLDEYGRTSDRGLVDRAREHLERAIELNPGHAPSYAALGYACDLSSLAELALSCFREARLLDPRHKEYQVYAITLLIRGVCEGR